MPELNVNQRKILNDAYKTMKDGSGVLKDNDKIKAFAAERAEIDKAAAKKTPFIKEFINLHKESESKAYTNIGRMVKDMKIVAAEQEALKKAAKMCKDEADREVFLQLAEELNTHPAMLDYEKYIKGLRFISGLDEKVDKEVEDFFTRDLRIVLWVNDSDFDRWRLTEQQPAETVFEENNQEYQKLTSKAKARELFAHRTFEAHMSVFEQFSGVRNPGNAVGAFGERMTPAAFCVGKLLQEGYSLDEVLNPKLLLKEKKAIGEEYMKQRNSGTLESQQWYMNEMYRNAEAMIKAYHRYIKEHKDELKTEQDLVFHASYLGMLSMLCFDMMQELTKNCKNVHTEFKTEKEFSDMGYRVGTYYYGAGTGTAGKILYEFEGTLEPAEYIREILRQLAIKSFLEEVQKDDLDVERIAIPGADEMKAVEQQLSVLEEFEDYSEWDVPDDKNRKKVIDPEKFTSKQIKVLASMMDQKYVTDKQMSVTGLKVNATVKEDPEYCNGTFIEKGYKLGVIVTAGGKQLVQTDIPYKYFNDLEKKGIRGKAKDNSDEFNNLIRHYAETMQKLESTNSLNKDCIDELNKLKAAAAEYINAKRAQKGYESKEVPDTFIDNMMLGKEKGGASIFTSRGKDRYQFALDLIERAKVLENKFNELEMQNLEKENENKEVKQSDTTVVKEEKVPEIAPKGAEIPAPAAETKTNEAAEIKAETSQPTEQTTPQPAEQTTPQPTEQPTPQPTPQPTTQPTTQPTPQPEKPKKPTQKEMYIEKMNNYLAQDENEMEPHQKAARANLVEWASISLGSKANLYGDPKKIQKYMDNHTNLNVLQIEHLQERKEANEKIQNYHDNRSLGQKKRPPCLVDGDNIMLNKARPVPRQTSASGCWSCVLSDMLAHFGVDLTQKEIRYYRPKFRPESLKKETFEKSEAFKIMSRLCFDTQNEIYDVADLIHTTVPNVALHHMQVDPQTPGIGEKFLNKVKDILINHNSPIAVCMKGHYRAIVGVEGDRLIIEDSAKTIGRYTTGVDSFLAECTDKGDRIIVDWLQDITFTKDGKCSIVTEQTKLNNLDCKDGVFSDSAFEYDSHVSGNEYFLDADGMGETVYLPKMAFEKEMNIPYEVVEEHNIAVDESQNKMQNEMQNEVQENSVEEQEQVNEEPKYSKREILNDTDLLINDPQMFEFAKAVVRLMNDLNDAEIAGLTYYDDWSDEMKAKIPMDMLVNDLELGYSEEQLRLMNTEELRDVLKDVVDLQTFFYAEETIQERQSEMENEQGDMCM